MSNRIFKVNELIKKNINDILLRELSLKDGVFITVSKVDTSPDLRYTHIFISVFPEKERDYIFKTLRHEMFKIQGKFNKRLHMKPLPKIFFENDDTESKADEIEKLFKEL